MKPGDPKTLLLDIYRSAVEGVDAGSVLRRALHDAPETTGAAPVWVIALGKAAEPMAEAAARALADQGRTPAGGLTVSSVLARARKPPLPVFVGDHPEPGAQSLQAAEALARVVGQIPQDATVWVLISGGTTSLVGAPQPGIPLEDLKRLYASLLRSGLDIKMMNRVRKRFTRWGAGRLARALGHARLIRCYIVSDVIGDDLAAIASGPCVPDPSTAGDVRDALVRNGLWTTVAASLRQHLDDVEKGVVPETPKPGEAPFDRVESRLVATNRMALEAAGKRAAELGLTPEIVAPPIVGEASEVGATIAETLVARGRSSAANRCLILGGETTVTIRDHDAGRGGRSQELALAAARALRGAPPAIALLAAGTDGRDGPTDAAGAVVDGTTWDRIAAAGRDPLRDLQRHDSYASLAAGEALIKTGATGTNVMDVVIGLG